MAPAACSSAAFSRYYNKPSASSSDFSSRVSSSSLHPHPRARAHPHPQPRPRPQHTALGGQHIVRAEPPHEAAPALADDDPPPSPPPPSAPKQSLLEALDFSEVRSQDDAQLLDEARDATSMGEKMSREQYAALRRKIGGTYRDFFKDSIEVEGDFVDEGWVDKSCRFCKKDTASEPRTVDKFGRYAHITCLEKSKSGNFFTRLFGM